jgi:hypothetical protein
LTAIFFEKSRCLQKKRLTAKKSVCLKKKSVRPNLTMHKKNQKCQKKINLANWLPIGSKNKIKSSKLFDFP